MSIDLMFVLATAAFAWGMSLATYRWFAMNNTWPMGAWQSEQPWLLRAIGLGAVLVAIAFALARGSGTAVVLPLLGLLCAFCWTGILKVGAQSALLFAPAAAILVLIGWIAGAV